jgi:hypothetical protein
VRRRATSILPKGLGYVRNYYFFYLERRRGNIAAAFAVLVAAEYQVKKASAADHFTFCGTDDGLVRSSIDQTMRGSLKPISGSWTFKIWMT